MHSYVPVLKLKDAETAAVAAFAPEKRREFQPLFEIPSLSWKKNKKQGIDRLQTIPELLKAITRSLKPLAMSTIWFDGIHLPRWVDEQKEGDEQHPFAVALQAAVTAHVTAIPVIGLDRAPRYEAAALAHARKHSTGLCVRVGQAELFSESIEADLSELLKRTEVAPKEVDLVMDLGAVRDEEENLLKGALVPLIQRLKLAKESRTLVVASGAFPSSLSDVKVLKTFPRSDLALWQNVVAKLPPTARRPLFGDYAVQRPGPVEPMTAVVQPAPNIRYAGEGEWTVLKGISPKTGGYDQSHELAAALIRMPVYCGREFSPGDKHIFDVAAQVEGPGSGTTWRRVGSSHHIALTLKQVVSKRGV